MRQKPHVRICGGLGSETTLVYPTQQRRVASHVRRVFGRHDVVVDLDRAIFQKLSFVCLSEFCPLAELG